MPIPTYDRFIEPLLHFLALNPDGTSAREAHDYAAIALGLSEEDRLQRLPSGLQPIYKNRAGWAHDRLKRAGLSSSPRRGFWQLTPAGTMFVSTHPTALDAALVERLATDFMDVRLRATDVRATSVLAVASSQSPTPIAALASPDERLGQALDEMRQAAARDLLEFMGKASPAYFETIVLDLLHRLGYGASRADLQRVGGSGDGGIDGVIALDRLGLEKVYVQAKRWQNNVGRPELQAFYGALAGQKAKKGVFITTSAYTTQALDFARSVEGMVLVDGERLADLMIDCELGVTSRTFKVPKIDSDYFDEEGV